VALHEVVRKDRDVAFPVAQRRQLEARDVQPVKEIGAEAIVGDRGLERRIGSRDDSRGKQALLGSAEPAKTPILDHPKKLCLKLERQLCDFIQKNGPAASYLEQSPLEIPGIGEGTGLVSEEFALQQSFRNGGAVDCHEWLRRALTRRVDATRKQLLTGTRFPNEQNRHAATGGYLGR
jgi:hypothetical protein